MANKAVAHLHRASAGTTPLSCAPQRDIRTNTGLEADQVSSLKQLQEENTRLKRLVVELSLNQAML